MIPFNPDRDLPNVKIAGTDDYFDLADWRVYSQEFRKKPVVIKALRLEVPIEIETLTKTIRGEVGDWLICDTNGEFYSCKHDVFKKNL